MNAGKKTYFNSGSTAYAKCININEVRQELHIHDQLVAGGAIYVPNVENVATIAKIEYLPLTCRRIDGSEMPKLHKIRQIRNGLAPEKPFYVVGVVRRYP